MVPDSDAPRWAQLTYASFDPGDGAGGWQVKETRGGLDPSETAALSALFVTAFDSHAPLPDYPTPSDIAAQPRRFAYLLAQPTGADGMPGARVGQYIHAVQAGSDSTGRPGNVFTHAVLDRRPHTPQPPLRPIELWRSFDLLTPYGAEQVLSATIATDERPEPAGMVGLDMVVDFLFDPSTWRIGVLSVLLDAVDEALRGGRRVLLAVPSADQAALWIGAVSRLMSADAARGLSWSVYERAGRLAAAWERGTHLAAIPVSDLDSLTADDLARWIVVRDDETPALGQPGHSPHRTAAGSSVHPTPFSELAQNVLLDRDTASRALREIDDIAARAGDAGLHPFWPLAVTVLRFGGHTALARDVALDLLPQAPLTDPELLATLRNELAIDLGETAADAWHAVESLERTTPRFARESTQFEYLARAFRDDEWLARPGGAPVPELDLRTGAAATVHEAFLSRLDTAGPDDAATLVRIVDLAARAGMLEPGDGQAAEGADRSAAIEALQRVVVPVLLETDPDGAIDVDLPRPADARVVQELVPAALAAEVVDDRSGQPIRLRTDAQTWLTAEGPSPELVVAAAAAAAGDADAALSIGVVDRASAVVMLRTGRSLAGLGALVQLVLLDEHGSWDAIPDDDRVVTPSLLWEPASLLGIERRFPGALPEEFLIGTLSCIADATTTLPLSIAVAARATPTTAVRIACVRAWAEAAARGTNQPGTDRDVRTVVAEIVATYQDYAAIATFGPLLVDAALSLAIAEPEAADWTATELAALDAAVATDELVDAAHALQAARSDRPAAAADRLAGIAALAIAVDPDGLDRDVSAQARTVVDLVTGEGDPLLETLVLEGLTRGVTDQPGLVRAIGAHLQSAGRQAEADRAAKSWVRGLVKGQHRRPVRSESRRGLSRRPDPKES